jgi:hypothetical protein
MATSGPWAWRYPARHIVNRDSEIEPRLNLVAGQGLVFVLARECFANPCRCNFTAAFTNGKSQMPERFSTIATQNLFCARRIFLGPADHLACSDPCVFELVIGGLPRVCKSRGDFFRDALAFLARGMVHGSFDYR